jgi:hypothetical protein
MLWPVKKNTPIYTVSAEIQVPYWAGQAMIIGWVGLVGPIVFAKGVRRSTLGVVKGFLQLAL